MNIQIKLCRKAENAKLQVINNARETLLQLEVNKASQANTDTLEKKAKEPIVSVPVAAAVALSVSASGDVPSVPSPPEAMTQIMKATQLELQIQDTLRSIVYDGVASTRYSLLYNDLKELYELLSLQHLPNQNLLDPEAEVKRHNNIVKRII